MPLKSYKRIVYDWFTKHWLLSALITSIPALAFPFIEIFGVNLGLVNEAGVVNDSVKWFLFAIFGVCVIYNFSLAWANHYDTQVKANGQYVFQQMIGSLDAIKDTKLRRFTNYISNNHGRNQLSPFYDITQPRMQIESILENLQNTLANIFGLDRHNISLSVIYRIDKSPNTWQWLYTFNVANDWRLTDLLSNSRSTMRQIIDGKTTSMFYPNKKTAIDRHEYLPGPKDNSHNNTGSIICRDISIDSEKSVHAILSISTYGHQICEEDDLDTKEKVENLLLPSFEKRIKLELALLYIKEIMAST